MALVIELIRSLITNDIKTKLDIIRDKYFGQEIDQKTDDLVFFDQLKNVFFLIFTKMGSHEQLAFPARFLRFSQYLFNRQCFALGIKATSAQAVELGIPRSSLFAHQKELSTKHHRLLEILDKIFV